MNVREARGRRADLMSAAQKLINSARIAGKDLAGAELEQYQGYIHEIKELDAKIEKAEAHGAHNFNAAPWVGEGDHATHTMATDSEGRAIRVFDKGQSISDYVKQQQPDNPNVSLGDLAKAMVTGRANSEVRAALNQGTDSSGGVTVPTLLSTQLIDMLRARSTVFTAGARTMMLDTGKATTIAAIASDPVAGWRAENAAVSTSDMTFSPVSLTPKTLAVCVLASRELIEDSLNLNEALIVSLTKSFAAELDRVALIGSGTSNQPLGVSKVSGVGSVSMGTNGAALTSWDPFVQALGTLRTANAEDPTAVIYHPRSDQELNLLKDSQNRPLVRPACLDNIPFMVTSKLPINETQGSANTASRAIVGNFREVIVGIRHQISIEVLREKYSDNLQYGFLAYLRADVAVAHAASFCNVVGIL